MQIGCWKDYRFLLSNIDNNPLSFHQKKSHKRLNVRPISSTSSCHNLVRLMNEDFANLTETDKYITDATRINAKCKH